MMWSKTSEDDMAQKIKELLNQKTEEEKTKKEEEEREKIRNRETAQQLLSQHKELLEQATQLGQGILDEETRALLSSLTSKIRNPSTDTPPSTHNEMQQQFIEQLKKTLGHQRSGGSTEGNTKTVSLQVQHHSGTRRNNTETSTPETANGRRGKTSTWQTGWQGSTSKTQVSWDLIVQMKIKLSLANQVSWTGQHQTYNTRKYGPKRTSWKDWADEEVSFNQNALRTPCSWGSKDH